MPRCTRKGCGQEFEQGSSDGCTYHSGAPVFHEGLKSWSCCANDNKPVMDFDEFMKIPGCTHAEHHSDEEPLREQVPKPSSTTPFTLSGSESGKEVYTRVEKTPAPPAISAPTPIVEEEDDLNVSVNPGSLCRRNGCKTLFISDAINRHGDGEGTVCMYHPAPPIFRGGSKGYLCCKRRVLEFDEFLKIPGCKTGRHLFSPAVTNPITEEMTTCRVDHYQTIDHVYVSIFAKEADRERSAVQFSETEVNLNIYLAGSKRFSRILRLFGPIDPTQCTLQFFKTKVELHLKKQDTRSWTLLEKTSHDISNINLTFGVGGRTGTVGAKTLALDGTNKARE